MRPNFQFLLQFQLPYRMLMPCCVQVPNTIPIGTFFVRAFVLQNSSAPSGLPQAQVAFGTSKGYFEVRSCLHVESCGSMFPGQGLPQTPCYLLAWWTFRIHCSIVDNRSSYL